MEHKCKNNWYVRLAISVIVMLASASVFLFIVQWMHFTSLNINDMMVSFVGILATFIVINNYAQVQEIKNDCITEIKKYKSQAEEQTEYIRQLANQTMQYKAVQQLLRDMQESTVSSKYEWVIWGLKQRKDTQLTHINVKIKKIAYNAISQKFDFTFIDDNGEDITPSLEEVQYIDSRDIMEPYHISLADDFFTFLLKRELDKQ